MKKMNIIEYPYRDIDCLKFPQKYQMSKYQGIDFLIAYKKHRKEIIKKTTIKNQDIKKQNYHNSKKYEEEFLKINKKQSIQTEKILWFIYNKVSENNLKKEYKTILNEFIKKFENTKKIFDFYEYDLSTKSENFRIFRNYLILSLICIKLYEKKMNLKYLNTSLKINDILCSNFKEISDEIDLQLLNESLQLELKCIVNLIKKKGLKDI